MTANATEGPDATDAGENPKKRQRRYVSHALVEVRKFRQLPIFCYSAVLLDMSLSGFKLEFTGEVRTTPGKRYWLYIPLAPLGITAPKKMLCLCECRWFDESRFRIGGVFIGLNKTDHLLIEQIVAGLKERGQI